MTDDTEAQVQRRGTNDSLVFEHATIPGNLDDREAWQDFNDRIIQNLDQYHVAYDFLVESALTRHIYLKAFDAVCSAIQQVDGNFLGHHYEREELWELVNKYKVTLKETITAAVLTGQFQMVINTSELFFIRKISWNEIGR
jgi:hypothetical protein